MQNRKNVDKYGRIIDYLRISVTDRCNLRCIYCVSEHGITIKNRNEILTFEEIKKIVELLVPLGINKIKITGGEPLVRKDIITLVSLLANIKGIADLSMTTNGILLNKYVELLKNAGIKRINVSLDTLQENKYRSITKTGELRQVFGGIKKAKKLGLFVKINTVVIKGINDNEISDFIKFSGENDICVRFIELMPSQGCLFWNVDRFIPLEIIKRHCEHFGVLKKIDMPGNGPAEYYEIDSIHAKIGFIGAISARFCSQCNRLRLTSDGKLKFCLFNMPDLNLKEMFRKNLPVEEIEKLIQHEIINKPDGHRITLLRDSFSTIGLYHSMCKIGG